MRLSQAWVVAQKDLAVLRKRRSVLYSTIAFPLGVAIGFPLLISYILVDAGPSGAAGVAYLLPAFSFFFVIAAGALPTTIASYSLVGEKVERSLEPLLATPTTDGEILLGKTIGALVPTLGSIWGSALVFMGLVDALTLGPFGYLYYPNVTFALQVGVLAPMVCLLSVQMSVLVSSRVNDVRAANQYAGLIFLPLIVIYIAAEIGAFPLDDTNTALLAAALLAINLGLCRLSRGAFQRDQILTQWK